MASIQGPRPATLDEAAEFFRVSRSTVQRLIRDGIVPTYSGFTRATRIDLAEMDAALKKLRKTKLEGHSVRIDLNEADAAVKGRTGDGCKDNQGGKRS